LRPLLRFERQYLSGPPGEAGPNDGNLCGREPMQSDSILGFVSTKMAHSPEDIATEALHYVLRRSPGARAGMTRFLGRIAETPPDLLFRTQVVGDNLERPDLVGIDPEGREVFILEAKFWAELRPTPMWLLVKSAGDGESAWTYSPEARKRLRSLELETPSRLIRLGARLLVPITLPTGEERDTVLDRMEAQVMEVIALLRDGNLE